MVGVFSMLVNTFGLSSIDDQVVLPSTFHQMAPSFIPQYSSEYSGLIDSRLPFLQQGFIQEQAWGVPRQGIFHFSVNHIITAGFSFTNDTGNSKLLRFG
jgi:hypothetical protein